MKTYQLEKGMLPADAQRALKLAALTPIPRGDPLARIKAIERAIEQIKVRHRNLFDKNDVMPK